MSYNEAQTASEPLKTTLIKNRERSYIPVIIILFAINIALCANNFVIYKSFNEVEKNYNSTYQELKSYKISNSDVLKENESLKNENKSLKDNYNYTKEQNENILKQIEDIKKQNDDLSSTNNELTNDNIALQNSLKKAAAVGIKPQNYSSFNGVTSRGEVDKSKYLGKFLGTAYTPSKDECGNSNGITNSGQPIIPGISVAIDNNYWPFGTVFYIKGLGYAVAMDTGSAIKGKNRFDFAVLDKNFARKLGTNYWEVYLVKMGDGDIDKINF